MLTTVLAVAPKVALADCAIPTHARKTMASSIEFEYFEIIDQFLAIVTVYYVTQAADRVGSQMMTTPHRPKKFAQRNIASRERESASMECVERLERGRATSKQERRA